MAEQENMREMVLYEKYRAGNFKVQLVRLLIDDKGTSRELRKEENLKKEYLAKFHYEEIRAVKIMTLEETWCERYPQHYGMFSLIVDLVRIDTKESMDELQTLCTVAYCTSAIGNGFFMNLVLVSLRAHTYGTYHTISRGEKKKLYKSVLKHYEYVLKKDLEGYKPKKRKELSDEEFRQMEIADAAREQLKE